MSKIAYTSHVKHIKLKLVTSNDFNPVFDEFYQPGMTPYLVHIPQKKKKIVNLL